MKSSINWKKEARRHLRVQMALKEVNYKALARKLEAVGIEESPKVISNKIMRGAFSFAFFLQCMHVLDVHVVTLKDK